MPKKTKPRSGSMQFWPRKRAGKSYAKVNSWADSSEAKPLAFAGYKVGMTHVMGVDNAKNSMTKGEEIPYPVTILECPPMRIASVRFHVKDGSNMRVAGEKFVGDHKDLRRKLDTPDKPESLDDVSLDDYDDVTIIMHTLPSKTGIGSKKPQLFEVHLGGSKEDKFNYVKDNVGKDIRASDIFDAGDLTDTHGITKGHGTQGPVKRFGIGLKSHKSQKGRRRPGSLGGWIAQQHFMYRVPMAGQTGYHQRTQNNIQIFKMGDEPEEIQVEGGFKKYGEVKNDYIMVKGSVQGPAKRMIILTKAARPNKKKEIPTITYISKTSKQGL